MWGMLHWATGKAVCMGFVRPAFLPAQKRSEKQTFSRLRLHTSSLKAWCELFVVKMYQHLSWDYLRMLMSCRLVFPRNPAHVLYTGPIFTSRLSLISYVSYFFYYIFTLNIFTYSKPLTKSCLGTFFLHQILWLSSWKWKKKTKKFTNFITFF